MQHAFCYFPGVCVLPRNLLATARVAREGAGAGGVLVCYYTASRALVPRDIHPQLCTHINVAFAQVRDKQIQLDDNLRRTLREIVKLKTVNPALKILLSIGGAGDNDGFSDMVVDHASRKTFIRSIKYVLRNYTLDGIDLDWEFPAIHYTGSKGRRERQHFSQLLREIRAEYVREKRDYLLTVAVAAQQSIADTAYDVDQINMYADLVNIMTYDFHFFTKYTPFTGLNSPLYARTSEELFFASLNINFTVNMYLDKGLSKDKLVVGIPTYGHTFTLVNADNTAIGSPASGFGALGSLGFVNFPDICNFIQNATNNVVVKYDNETKVPYLYGGSEWVSYDSPQSVTEKAKFIRSNGLRGAMIYSLNADDYQGVCRQGVGNDIKFPLANAVRKLLNYNEYV
ncbi:glycosyl hydrolases family 18 domain-containing protein [Phthorimaea operculella]|nr:glycosyl hydrolases family 18 domain-containing protein [Phthorimaea operculella]